MMSSKPCAEAALMDEKLISSYMHFNSMVTQLQVQILCPEAVFAASSTTLPSQVNSLFANYPEW